MRKSSCSSNELLIIPGYLHRRHRKDGDDDKEDAMWGRVWIMMLALAIGLALPLAGVAVADDDGKTVKHAVKRDDDRPLVAADDDDGGDDDDWTRSRKSRDRTNSRHTGVSRDRDRSRGDLTRDKTRDGPGGKKRDWSRHHTNDASRNDTR